MTITQTNPLIRETRRMFTKDGRQIDVPTDVKNEMPKELIGKIRKELTEKIANNYNEGRGSKGDYIPGDNPFAVADSTSRVSASAPGLQCFFRFRGEDTKDPDASYTLWESFTGPQKMDLYC